MSDGSGVLILNAFGQILLNVQCDVAVAKTSLKSVRVCVCVRVWSLLI